MVKRALAEHQRLKRLFGDKTEIEKSLSLIEEELEAHVRFEERILFNKIQQEATKEQLALISEKHTGGKFQENTEDEFWLRFGFSEIFIFDVNSNICFGNGDKEI